MRRGSGTFYNLAQELERQSHIVTRLGPFPLEVPFVARVVNAVHRRLRKRHPLFLDPFVGGRTGRLVSRQLQGLDYDFLLTNDMAIAAFTVSGRPIVLYTDVIVTRDYSEKNLPGCRLGNMSAFSVGLCRRTMRRALMRSSLAIFPADWSAEAARAYCRTPEKIKVVPFGANVEDPGSAIAHGRSWEKIKAKGCINLLFVGKDWVRKGGDVAVEAVRRLNADGIRAKLHVVGAEVPDRALTDEVQSYGLLDKSKPEEMALIQHLFTEADAFILPSSSEGYVISVLEAAAFGLPTLAYDADGVRNAVVAGRTGLLFPLGSPGRLFAAAVSSWCARPSTYMELVHGARHHYETSANWPCCVKALEKNIRNALNASVSGRGPNSPRSF